MLGGLRRACQRAYSAAANEVDVMFIGAGPGGYVGAIKAAQLGLKTACVEKRATLGGTCLNVGCIPSKALLNSSHKLKEAQNDLSAYGVDVQGVKLNLPKMMAQKEKAVRTLTGGIEMLFKKNKVIGVKGEAKLKGPNQVLVTGPDGKEETWKAKHIVLATGSDIIPLPGLAVDEKTVVSSTGALGLQQVPKRMVVIGGGVIGLELVLHTMCNVLMLGLGVESAGLRSDGGGGLGWDRFGVHGRRGSLGSP